MGAPFWRTATLPRFLASKALAGTRAEPVVVVLSLAVQVLVFFLEVWTPTDVTFTPYALLVVLLNAWLIGRRPLTVVTASAVLIQLLRAEVGNATVLTAVLNGVALCVAAALASSAATNSASTRRSRERQLESLLETARVLNQASELADVLTRVTQAGANEAATGAASALAVQLDGDAVLAEGRSFPLTRELRTALGRRGAHEVVASALTPELRDRLGGGMRAVAVAPIVIGGKPFGGLLAAAPESFTAAQLSVLSGLGELAGIAAARAGELEAQTTRARVLEVLREVLLATASATAPEDVAQRVVDEAKSMLGAQTVALALRDRARPGLWLKAASRPLEMAAVDPDSVLGRAFHDATPMLAAAGGLLDAADRDIALGGARLAAAPVLAGQDCLGVIAAALDSATDERVRLLALLGSQLGSAVLASELRGELVESERVFRSLCAGLGCAAVLHDATGKLVDANWAVESLTGVSVGKITASGIFGPEWSMRSEIGADVPLSMRPPRYVMSFDRPLLGMVAEIAGPGGRPVWVRIDSNPILEHGRLKWIVTTFYPVPAPVGKRKRSS